MKDEERIFAMRDIINELNSNEINFYFEYGFFD
jgi:hypothetical protein